MTDFYNHIYIYISFILRTLLAFASSQNLGIGTIVNTLYFFVMAINFNLSVLDH